MELGKGGFGAVVEVYDIKQKKFFAKKLFPEKL